MDIDLRSAQDYVDWFITEMRFYDVPPAEVAFLTDSTEEDCDFLFWEHMYRTASLYDPRLPRPYRPAKWLYHVTVEGWEVECGPAAAYVVTPAGECFWRFQPGHLMSATESMRPVSSVQLVGNQDSALIHTLECGRESYLDRVFEVGRIEQEIAEAIPQFIAAMNQLGVAPREQDFFYSLEGAWPDLPAATVLHALHGDASITRLPLTATTGLTAVGWLVEPHMCAEPLLAPCFVITPTGSVLPLHATGDSGRDLPPSSLTPISTAIQDDYDLRVCDAFLCALQDTMQAWGIDLDE